MCSLEHALSIDSDMNDQAQILRELDNDQVLEFSKIFHKIFPIPVSAKNSVSFTQHIVKMSLSKASDYLLYSPSENWMRTLLTHDFDFLRYEKVCQWLNSISSSSSAGVNAHSEIHSTINKLQTRLPPFSMFKSIHGGVDEHPTFNNSTAQQYFYALKQLGLVIMSQTPFVYFWREVFGVCQQSKHSSFQSMDDIEENAYWVSVTFILVLGSILEVLEETGSDFEEDQWRISTETVINSIAPFSVLPD